VLKESIEEIKQHHERTERNERISIMNQSQLATSPKANVAMEKSFTDNKGVTTYPDPKLKAEPEEVFNLKKRIFDMDTEVNEFNRKYQELMREVENYKAMLVDSDQKNANLDYKHKQLLDEYNSIRGISSNANSTPKSSAMFPIDMGNKSPLNRSFVDDGTTPRTPSNVSMDLGQRKSSPNTRIIFSDNKGDRPQTPIGMLSSSAKKISEFPSTKPSNSFIGFKF